MTAPTQSTALFVLFRLSIGLDETRKFVAAYPRQFVNNAKLGILALFDVALRCSTAAGVRGKTFDCLGVLLP